MRFSQAVGPSATGSLLQSQAWKFPAAACHLHRVSIRMIETAALDGKGNNENVSRVLFEGSWNARPGGCAGMQKMVTFLPRPRGGRRLQITEIQSPSEVICFRAWSRWDRRGTHWAARGISGWHAVVRNQGFCPILKTESARDHVVSVCNESIAEPRQGAGSLSWSSHRLLCSVLILSCRRSPQHSMISFCLCKTGLSRAKMNTHSLVMKRHSWSYRIYCASRVLILQCSNKKYLSEWWNNSTAPGGISVFTIVFEVLLGLYKEWVVFLSIIRHRLSFAEFILPGICL